MATTERTVKNLGSQALFTLLVLGAWQVLASSGALGSMLPDVPSTLTAFLKLLVQPGFWGTVGATLLGAAQGFLAAVAVGVVLGVAAGTLGVVERSLHVFMELGRSFPVIALLPVIVLVWGTTTSGKAVIVFVACVFPMYVQTYYGARQAPASLREMAAGFRVPRSFEMRMVMLPASLPAMLTGIRIAASIALLVAVGAEIVTGMAGIGKEIMSALLSDDSARSFAYILTTGVLGILVGGAVNALGRFLLRKHEKSHAHA